MTEQRLKVYSGSVVIATLKAPEGGKLQAATEPSGALRVSRWFFADPLEVKQPTHLFAPGAWTSVEEVWE